MGPCAGSSLVAQTAAAPETGSVTPVACLNVGRDGVFSTKVCLFTGLGSCWKG